MNKYSPGIIGFGLLLLLALCSAGTCLAADNPDNLYRQGKYKEAMAGYEKLDLDHPKDISYRFNRGCAAYQLQDYQSAQAAFTSVYARAQDNTMRYKAAFNLGNTGYQAGDFRSAADSYKEALRLNPQSSEARYNLELALKKIEQAKKDKDQEKQQGKSCQRKQDKPDKQQKDQQDKQDKQQEQKDQQAKGEQKQDQAKSQAKEQPKDLSGELKATNPAQMQKNAENQKEQQQAKSVERKKAEALLNNIQEDRTRYLKFQVPEDKVKSGKYW